MYSKLLGFSSVFGVGESLELVELLFISLLVQAMSTLNTLSTDTTSGVQSRKRSFRQSYFVSFATRIVDRLFEAKPQTEKSVEKDYAGSLLPILAERIGSTDEAVNEAYPELVVTHISASDTQGWLAGVAAGDRASLTSSKAEID